MSDEVADGRTGLYGGLSDELLMDTFNKGDRKAFEEIVSRYQQKITAFIYRTVGNLSRADELAQETFLRVLRKGESFDPKRKFSTWIYTIARNLALNEIRDSSRHPAVVHIAQSDWNRSSKNELQIQKKIDDPINIIVDNELKRALEKAMGDLSEDLRMALVLREYDGLSYAEIAGILDAAEGTVKSWIFRAKKQLAKSFKDMNLL